jgi:hypothetical protein
VTYRRFCAVISRGFILGLWLLVCFTFFGGIGLTIFAALFTFTAVPRAGIGCCGIVSSLTGPSVAVLASVGFVCPSGGGLIVVNLWHILLFTHHYSSMPKTRIWWLRACARLAR